MRRPDFDKVGLLAMRGSKILLCRKKHTTALLILPGGCKEAGESVEACLHRELREELGDAVSATNLISIGVYESPAAGALDKIVRIELLAGDLTGEPEASSEIKEVIWFDPSADDWNLLAPSLREVIFPALIRQGRITIQ